MQFEFLTATRIRFGPGVVREAGPLARQLGSCALLVTGQNAARAERLVSDLSAQKVAAINFPVAGEPAVATLRTGVALAKSEACDLVIAFGGGSALDMGKAIAAMLANEGDVLEYLEMIGKGRGIANPSRPFIAIPTTAGTGSEVTRNAVLGSPERRVKVSLRSPLMLARVALVDPELTYDLPPSITASTGLDALTQLIEPYTCSRANPLVDALCIEGIGRCARALRTAFERGRKAPDARNDMALCSLIGGLALANAGLGAVHGLAGPIGGMFAAPHGAVCAALLPHVVETNLHALGQRAPESDALRRYERVARLVTDNPAATANDAVLWLRKLIADLQIPSLGSYGVEPKHFAELIEKARQSSSMKANPIELTADELSEALSKAVRGRRLGRRVNPNSEWNDFADLPAASRLAG
jgi:alcohol dehydrogenase class IV